MGLFVKKLFKRIAIVVGALFALLVGLAIYIGATSTSEEKAARQAKIEADKAIKQAEKEAKEKAEIEAKTLAEKEVKIKEEMGKNTQDNISKENMNTAENNTSNLNDDLREKIKQYFLSDKEPTVKDATWTSDYMFKVGVIDDGTNRDGFASYVCETLRSDFGISDEKLIVEVIDIQKLVDTNKWVELGQSICK